ncbi:unnamed protein product [Phyllotreta striolata]|uniref:Uncharacterized protein n=1 Tax=Phyllotreta striolata TaxID=444603 RepID=A0A9N9TPI5_PHYSR|nr:unnamed protein product [Phyllotreta striolata]
MLVDKPIVVGFRAQIKGSYVTDALRLQSLNNFPCHANNCYPLSDIRHCPSPCHPPLSSASEAVTRRTPTSGTTASSKRKRRKRNSRRRRRRRRRRKRTNVLPICGAVCRECVCAVIRTIFELLHQIPRTFTRYFCTTITIVFG